MNTNLSQTFNFDDEDRLTNWTSAGTSSLNGSQSWNLSLTGSWASNTIDGVAENRNYNSAYEILDVNGSPLFYDAKGNLTDNKDGSEYKYDFDNQIFQSTNAATIDTDYTYDALGRRISLESQGVTTLFVYCGYQVKTEYESTGGAFVETKSYVHGSYIDDVVAMIDTNNTYYYHSNRQFSVGALTDSLGNLRERYAYNAYGDMEVIYEDLSIDNPYYFTGRRLDTVSGLYYFRARYYDAVLGQFISRDPLGYIDGMGLYNGYYVPLGVDPSGLIDIESINSNGNAVNVTIQIVVYDLTKKRKTESRIKEVAAFAERLRGIVSNNFDTTVNNVTLNIDATVTIGDPRKGKSRNNDGINDVYLKGGKFVWMPGKAGSEKKKKAGYVDSIGGDEITLSDPGEEGEHSEEVITHEFGHLLGLKHPTKKKPSGGLMNDEINGSTETNDTENESIIDNLQKMGKKQKCPTSP